MEASISLRPLEPEESGSQHQSMRERILQTLDQVQGLAVEAQRLEVEQMEVRGTEQVLARELALALAGYFDQIELGIFNARLSKKPGKAMGIFRSTTRVKMVCVAHDRDKQIMSYAILTKEGELYVVRAEEWDARENKFILTVAPEIGVFCEYSYGPRPGLTGHSKHLVYQLDQVPHDEWGKMGFDLCDIVRGLEVAAQRLECDIAQKRRELAARRQAIAKR